jgi:hypothetical protein
MKEGMLYRAFEGSPWYGLVDTVLLHLIFWDGSQFCLYGEMKIVVEKPDGRRVSFGRTPE